MSGDISGGVYVWDTTTWNRKVIGQHYGAVTTISVHPSGKFVTVGKDKTVRTWDLFNELVSCCEINIEAVAEIVKWFPDGTYFVVAMNNIVS